MQYECPEGATPLDEDSRSQLIPSLTMQSELNEFEGANIEMAVIWAQKSRKLKTELLTIAGLQLLHRKMFDRTWRWAGKFRQVNTNIGVDWPLIQEAVFRLCGDVRFWTENNTYSWPELAVHFHFRLASIHPFPNGNGRHSRLATDLLLTFHQQPAFTWGGGSNLQNAGTDRKEYLAALREADAGEIARLLRFVRK